MNFQICILRAVYIYKIIYFSVD
jgi:hypothetical protein